MPPVVTFLISALGLLVSASIGGLTVWLSLRKRLEEEGLGKATRKTSALQLLSDEEFTLEQVRDECIVMNTLVHLRDDEDFQGRGYLQSETDRVIGEATVMLAEVRARRKKVESDLATMSLLDLEAAIATAYHGKKRAEAQLQRTRLSRTEVLKAYGVYSPGTKKGGA